ncbi:hypothetical protein AKJ09_05963 [Labilithrix luteola]|uniref:Uncharacterized protein n=1 Tax=Labilithrix luteola TaxID=1391654 RepID=A0A0K1Q1P1_9BACT|nr:hypothetical protein AKJ09_05963 [Labilithrix luteola]
MAAQSGLLIWKPGGGVSFDFAVDPMVAQWFGDLQRLVLPGFPKAQ